MTYIQNKKTLAAFTLGCKVNQYETEAIEELFKNAGYDIVGFDEYADVYLINTCTVTSMSDRKSRQMIRRAKKINPKAVVVVTGCYAQTASDAVLNIDGVNLVIGTKDRKGIVDITESITADSKVSKVGNIMDTHTFEQLNITNYEERTRAYIKIQEGCNQYCTYCIIPYARGPIRSRDFDEVIDEVKQLASKGFTEVILTGIHVASYGNDLKQYDLSDLLIEVNKIDGIRRIRLSSIEPMTLDERFIEKIKPCTKLCPHFHLSLQSGSNGVLKRMNRKYTKEQYKSIVDGLRANFKNAAVTTDIMVGFPGETDEEFEECAEFVKETAFADAHIFQYSPRSGTPAAKMKLQIDPKVKELRSKRIIEITNKTKEEFLNRFIGKTVTVLFEQKKNGYFEGKTDNYITVCVKNTEDLSNTYRNVAIKRIEKGIAYGELTEV